MTALETRLSDVVTQGVLTGTWATKQLLALNYIDNLLRNDERYASKRHLCRFGYHIHSENGEDGMIAEIFKRIGTTNKYFVEIGVGNGMENNTAALFLSGWQGAWIDANPDNTGNINESLSFLIAEKRLHLGLFFVNRENVDEILDKLGVPAEFDFLSIDVDGMDYWIWKGMKHHQPRVVCIEYASSFPPPIECILKYQPDWSKPATKYHTASLQSLAKLALHRNMVPVGCDITGVNAFFVDKALAKGNFDEPFTAEKHYEPARFFLNMRWGHRSNIREWVIDDLGGELNE